MPDNPLWMFRPFLSPVPLPLEVISQLQEPIKALQMGLFFVLLLAGSIFDCQKRLIPNTLCALITMVGLLAFHPAQLMGPLAALPLLAAAMHRPGSIGGGDIKFTAASGFVLGITDGLWGMALGLTLAALFYDPTQGIRIVHRSKEKSWRQIKVFHDVEQLPERGHRNSIGDASDVGAALSKLQAHPMLRNALLFPQLCDAVPHKRFIAAVIVHDPLPPISTYYFNICSLAGG